MLDVMEITISGPKDIDRLGWERLYEKYRRQNGKEADAKAAQTVWTWISGQGKTLEGCIARTGEGHIIGFVHFREVPRPTTGGSGGYIDDIYVDEPYRGQGVAKKLIQGVQAVGRSRSWGDIRWVTSSDNSGAISAYAGIATRTSLVTFELKV